MPLFNPIIFTAEWQQAPGYFFQDGQALEKVTLWCRRCESYDPAVTAIGYVMSKGKVRPLCQECYDIENKL